MEKIVEDGLLYDYYGSLLTGHQRRICEMAVYEDLSLTEIADREKISKQAVSDLLRRTFAQLRRYEEKLRLMHRTDAVRSLTEKIRESTSLEEVKQLAENIEKEMIIDGI
ncbi:MAG: DNA-binding protein [Lachnospiraceae bacterium]|nr:DNA-binding protein [Lachnospiraceae bacterium]